MTTSSANLTLGYTTELLHVLVAWRGERWIHLKYTKRIDMSYEHFKRLLLLSKMYEWNIHLYSSVFTHKNTSSIFLKNI
jgi:hypothetical protein